MRLFKLPPLPGAWGRIAFFCGLVIALIGLGLVGFNVYLTGASTSQIFGGDVVTRIDKLWLPEVTVRTGGALGLGLGLLIGILFNLAEAVFWVFDDYSLGRQAKMVRYIVRIVETYDIGSSIFLLSGGTAILTLFQSDFVAETVRVFGATALAFLVLSFGAEIWFAFGVELMRANWGAMRGIGSGVGNIFDAIEGLKDADDHRPQRPPQMGQQPQRPRPHDQFGGGNGGGLYGGNGSQMSNAQKRREALMQQYGGQSQGNGQRKSGP